MLYLFIYLLSYIFLFMFLSHLHFQYALGRCFHSNRLREYLSYTFYQLIYSSNQPMTQPMTESFELQELCLFIILFANEI